MKQSIAQDFNTWKLLRFAFPSIIMMIFMSMYTIVDGMFVSRLVGSNALSAINIAWPPVSIIFSLGLMLATGGNAVVAMKFGEQKPTEAREIFSMIAVVGTIISILATVIILLFPEPLSRLLGANDLLLKDCMTYMIGLSLFSPAAMLQALYQSAFVTAGRPTFGLVVTIVAGVANGVLDFVFMGPMQLGVLGAALATGIGQLIPAVIGTVYFFNRNQDLYYQRFSMHLRELFHSCINGSSEMVTHLSNSIITIFFNLMLMRLTGPDGVAAITIILYGQFLLSALFLGFSMGVAPIFGYRHGAQMIRDLKRLLFICLKFVVILSFILTFVAFFTSDFVVTAFVEKGSNTWILASRGFRLFAIGYLFCGVNIFASGFFTAISDGTRSAMISFLRTFVFIIGALLVLPSIIDLDGVWLAIPMAEFLALFVSVWFLRGFVKKTKEYKSR